MSDENNGKNEDNNGGGRDWSKWKNAAKKGSDYAKKNPGKSAAMGIGVFASLPVAIGAGLAGAAADSEKGRKFIKGARENFEKVAKNTAKQYGVDIDRFEGDDNTADAQKPEEKDTAEQEKPTQTPPRKPNDPGNGPG